MRIRALGVHIKMLWLDADYIRRVRIKTLGVRIRAPEAHIRTLWLNAGCAQWVRVMTLGVRRKPRGGI